MADKPLQQQEDLGEKIGKGVTVVFLLIALGVGLARIFEAYAGVADSKAAIETAEGSGYVTVTGIRYETFRGCQNTARASVVNWWENELSQAGRDLIPGKRGRFPQYYEARLDECLEEV